MAKKKEPVKPINIKVIGTGGIGLCVLPVLTRYLNFSKNKNVELTLIDGDYFEEKNRERQEFDEYGPKATVTADRIRREFNNLTVLDHPVYIGDHNVNMMIRENDIVLVCVDNHATRKLLAKRAESLQNIVLINGGNELTDGNILVHIRKDGKDVTPSITKHHPEILASDDEENPANKQMKGAGCAVMVKSAPQLLIMNNYIAANMLAALWNILEEESYKQILESPTKHGEVYCDIKKIASIPAFRKA